GTGGCFSGCSFYVISWCAYEVQSSVGGFLRIVQYVYDGRAASFFGCAGTFDSIRNKAIPYISGRGVHMESGANLFRRLTICLHQTDKFMRGIWVDGPINKILFCTA